MIVLKREEVRILCCRRMEILCTDKLRISYTEIKLNPFSEISCGFPCTFKWGAKYRT
jgi:hypothetical protein